MKNEEELKKEIEKLEGDNLALKAKIVMLESKVEYLVDIINQSRKTF